MIESDKEVALVSQKLVQTLQDNFGNKDAEVIVSSLLNIAIALCVQEGADKEDILESIDELWSQMEDDMDNSYEN